MEQRTTDSTRPRGRSRSAFTLLEALMASTVLTIIVLAIASSITTAQQMAFEGQKRMLAAMVVDDLMTELLTLPYDDIRPYHGMREPLGAMETIDGDVYPDAYWSIGRDVSVRETIVYDEGTDTQVRGLQIEVSARDEAVVLASVEMFLPEPAE